MFCKSCGKKIESDAKFCDKCGSIVSEAAEVSTEKNNHENFVSNPVYNRSESYLQGVIKEKSKNYEVVVNPIKKLLSVIDLEFNVSIYNIFSVFNNINKYRTNKNKYDLLENQLRLWSLDQTVHTVFKLTFKQTFNMIMQIIENHPEKNNIKLLLIEELIDSVGNCFTGRMNRMINSLTLFVEGIKITISVREDVQIKIGVIVKKLIDQKIKKKDAIK